MYTSNLNLAIGKKEGYNNTILVSNTGIKIGSNKDRKKLPVAPADVPKKKKSDPDSSTRPTSQSKDNYQKAQ